MAGGDPRPVGVGEGGRVEPPWLGATLADALRFDTSHAMLLHAGVDLGQFDLALVLTQAWLCESDSRPCGRCAGCRQVRARTHPDHRVVVPDAMRLAFGWLGEDDPLLRAGAKPSREIRVEQIREAIEWTQRSAGSERGRALVIHPADALNPSAANALLKTLEEPPGRLRIVLTGTDPERLLPTLRSRVQRVRLAPPSRKLALAWLDEQGVEHGDALLAVAAGSPPDALHLAHEGVDAAMLTALPAQVARGDASALAGRPVPRVVDLLLKVTHDAMAHAVGAPPRYFDADALARPASLDALQRWRAELMRVARHDEHPWNAGLLIEALVTNGARCWAAPDGPRAARTRHSLHSTG